MTVKRTRSCSIRDYLGTNGRACCTRSTSHSRICRDILLKGYICSWATAAKLREVSISYWGVYPSTTIRSRRRIWRSIWKIVSNISKASLRGSAQIAHTERRSQWMCGLSWAFLSRSSSEWRWSEYLSNGRNPFFFWFFPHSLQFFFCISINW